MPRPQGPRGGGARQRRRAPGGRLMDLGLAGRTCVVTGASSGIGRAAALQLCAEAANVVLVARGDEWLRPATEEAARPAEPAGGAAAELVLDVTDEGAGEHMLAAAEDHFRCLDMLGNNAGAAKWRDLADVPDEDWRAQYELNVMAPLRAMRTAIPPMVDRGWCRVVN